MWKDKGILKKNMLRIAIALEIFSRKLIEMGQDKIEYGVLCASRTACTRLSALYWREKRKRTKHSIQMEPNVMNVSSDTRNNIIDALNELITKSSNIFFWSVRHTAQPMIPLQSDNYDDDDNDDVDDNDDNGFDTLTS